MGDVVNLRMARKARRRAEHAGRAAENRIRHGLSKAEKTLAQSVRKDAETRLEGHRIERPEDE